MANLATYAPIGIFDSGYGGLTILAEIEKQLPQYDYLYLGDNARSPYGTRSFETVYQYTWQSVQWLFAQGCPLVILACNTASAKALRSIQQRQLPLLGAPHFRVLGVLRPTTEVLGNYTRSGHVGILATPGTVKSQSYRIELGHFWPDLEVFQQDCPMWVPLIENNEHRSPGALYFVQKCLDLLLGQSDKIDTLLLACTHYPLLLPLIEPLLPRGVQAMSQGPLVARSLADYLQRHPDMHRRLSRAGARSFYTTDDPADFEMHAALFLGRRIEANHVQLS